MELKYQILRYLAGQCGPQSVSTIARELHLSDTGRVRKAANGLAVAGWTTRTSTGRNGWAYEMTPAGRAVLASKQAESTLATRELVLLALRRAGYPVSIAQIVREIEARPSSVWRGLNLSEAFVTKVVHGHYVLTDAGRAAADETLARAILVSMLRAAKSLGIPAIARATGLPHAWADDAVRGYVADGLIRRRPGKAYVLTDAGLDKVRALPLTGDETDQWMPVLISRYTNDGASIRQLSFRSGIPYATLHGKLMDYNVAMRPPGAPRRDGTHRNDGRGSRKKAKMRNEIMAVLSVATEPMTAEQVADLIDRSRENVRAMLKTAFVTPGLATSEPGERVHKKGNPPLVFRLTEKGHTYSKESRFPGTTN